MKTTKYLIIYMLLACVGLYSCQEIEAPINNIPAVTTNAVTKVGTTTASLTGEISLKNFSSAQFLLSTSENFEDCIYVDASNKGLSFYADVENLATGTDYYCVLSVTDGRSEVKGNVVTFMTGDRFEFDQIMYTNLENGEYGTFLGEQLGAFFFYDEKYRANNIEFSSDADDKWFSYENISLDAEQMMVYAYHPRGDKYEIVDNDVYVPVQNNYCDYKYGQYEYIAKENLPVKMYLNNAMSRISFVVSKTEDCEIEGTVCEIILSDNGNSMYLYGKMNLTTGEIISDEEVILSNSSTYCKFELSAGGPTIVSTFMFPAKFGENQIQVGIKMAGTDEVYYSYLPAGEWKKGESYEYPITLTAQGLKVGNVQITPWENTEQEGEIEIGDENLNK